MSESIISNKYQCIICGSMSRLHRHHVYGGVGRRNLSEKYGCWVYLCATHHNASDNSVHFNKKMDDRLKETCQIAWEARYGDREDFIRTFGRSYL